MTPDLRVYLVTDPGLGGARPVEHTVAAAVEGGVTIVQLRDKTAGPAALEAVARRLLAVLQGTGVPLVVNDDVEVARALGLGAHVGGADAAPVDARAALGPGVPLGVSTYAGRDLLPGEEEALDYVAVGPVWGTATKPDAGPGIGLEAVTRAAGRNRLPVVAIGGIDAARAGEAVTAGAAGVAVVSAVMAAADPRAAARAVRESVDAALAAREEGR
ncbi:thiamine phosphate synthase [Motilibacter aurantiacus]|uniref:thiamine phosphate synthase n=1 Tax=Motilibacter aurantiacus TaxID=2714955 RepID=UPI00140BD6A4|nr:thiamine phosphate synthase [Motilibacter aurantiacus]NHC44683.1 thiamine phosphate synthase [Motilibacter aurantiacus]